MAEIRS